MVRFLQVLGIYLATATVLELVWSMLYKPPAQPMVLSTDGKLKPATAPPPPLQALSPPPPPPPRAWLDEVGLKTSPPPPPPPKASPPPARADAEEDDDAPPQLPTDGKCWPLPRPFYEPPFDRSMASVVWTQPLESEFGPLDDVPAGERQRDWPPQQRERLLRLLPQRTKMEALRYDSCAVVGSSPELLLYEDGAAIDAHAAVFRANRAKVAGWEKHVGSRTTVRVVNPVEDVYGARKLDGGDKATVIIKNTDPPSIRSPGKEHGKFMGQAEKAGQADIHTNYIGRREALELCNFLFLMSGLAKLDMPASKRGKAKQLKHGLDVNATLAAFRRFAAEGEGSWHPMGDAIPRFSTAHCSTGTVLLVQALLLCKKTRLYGYHACACAKTCGKDPRLGANHYWDTPDTNTPRLDDMMKRYERHMLFYQLLERSCDLDFRIARKDHCDAT